MPHGRPHKLPNFKFNSEAIEFTPGQAWAAGTVLSSKVEEDERDGGGDAEESGLAEATPEANGVPPRVEHETQLNADNAHSEHAQAAEADREADASLAAENEVETPRAEAETPRAEALKAAPYLANRKPKTSDWGGTSRKRDTSRTRQATPKPVAEPTPAPAVPEPSLPPRTKKSSDWSAGSAGRRRSSSTSKPSTPKADEAGSPVFDSTAEPPSLALEQPPLDSVAELDSSVRKKKSSDWANSSSRRKR